MPYWCTDCRSYFSVRTGTILAVSKVPLRKWVLAIYLKMSPKHRDRYIREFAGKHNVREADAAAQMRHLTAALVGKRLMYRDLIAPNGLPSGARA